MTTEETTVDSETSTPDRAAELQSMTKADLIAYILGLESAQAVEDSPVQTMGNLLDEIAAWLNAARSTNVYLASNLLVTKETATQVYYRFRQPVAGFNNKDEYGIMRNSDGSLVSPPV